MNVISKRKNVFRKSFPTIITFPQINTLIMLLMCYTNSVQTDHILYIVLHVYMNHFVFLTYSVESNSFFVLCRDEVREKMHSRYLSNPEYTFEKVNRASMACGPMVKWAVAQVC